MNYRNRTTLLRIGTALLVLGSGQTLSACSAKPDRGSETLRVGQIQLPLETIGSEGNSYRLNNARFRITSVATGETVKTLKSELGVSILETELGAGEYTVTLLEGWELERLGGPVGTGGASTGGAVGIGGASAGGAVGIGGTTGTAGGPVMGPGVGGTLATGGASSTGGVGAGGVAAGGGVPAILVGNAVQFVSVAPNSDQFVFFTFRVGSEVIQFLPGRLQIGIEVIEDPEEPQCDTLAIQRRALFDSSVLATSALSLRQVFDALGANEDFATPGEQLFQEVIDSYATASEGRLPDAIHCGDESVDGQPTLNGFPIECNREERNQFDNLDLFFPTAAVNRLDLAPESGAHCGQQRLIFASNAQNRMFFIFEAQVPNPTPELGLAGCQPIADFWATQAVIVDPLERAVRLSQAFLSGLPELEEQGVGPFMTATNLTVGSGQIRTNQFDSFPWTLREFKLATDGPDLTVVPFPVAESPRGELWNDSIPTPQGEACRQAFLEAIPNLLTDPAMMSFPIPHECKDAESRNDFSQDYREHLLGGDPEGFQAQLASAVEGTGLNAIDVANRARFAGSCIGCHEEAGGSDLGNDVFAPFSNGFVHVDEFRIDECGEGEQCFGLSSAVVNVFLPHRAEVLSQFVQLPTIEGCDGGSGGGTGGIGGFPTGGASGVGGTSVGGGAAGAGPFPGPETGGAPAIEPVLPAASTPVSALVAQEEEMRAAVGNKTVGGQDARRTH